MPTLADLPKARVVVVGDVVLDQWIYGRVERISPEAPVPVFVQERVEEFLGGAGNVARNLDALGAKCMLCYPVYEVPNIKQRFIANGQQIFRNDIERIINLPVDLDGALATNPQVLVISDYAKGVCTPDLCQRLIGWAREHDCKVVVDPKGKNWEKYRGAYVITPNESEYQRAPSYTSTGLTIADYILVTKGQNGMTILGRGPGLHIPATTREVFDVTGAGDTVVAVLAAALAVGFDLPEAARMANAAAGVVVGKRGTATCSLKELEAALA